MRIGLSISALLHALILGFAILQLGSAQRELKLPEPEPVAVDIITESELTKLKQGNRRAKEPEATAPKTNVSETLKETPPKPKVAIVTPPPPPAPPKVEPKPADPAPVLEAMKTNEPKEAPKAPEIKPAEPKAPEPKPIEPVKPPEPVKEASRPDEVLEAMKANEPKPVEKKPEPPKVEPPKPEPPKIVQKPPPPPKKPLLPKTPPKPQVAVATPPPSPNKAFDVNDPDALNKILLDKTPNKRPPPPSATQTTAVATPPRSTLGAPEGRDQQLSASEIAALGAIIKRRIRDQGCWGVQGGGIDADRIQVKLRVKFNADGSVIGQPQVMNTDPSRSFQIAAENAQRAVLECQPYPLPPEKFSAWQDMILNFVPRDM